MKTLITTLGTGNYKVANYHLNGVYSKQTRLGFKALAELLDIPQDSIYVFGTEVREGSGQLRGSDWTILDQEFESPFSDEKKIPVPYGINKEEHYEFFEKVLSTLTSSDEIIFDITHGFRSTPVVFLMSLFFKFSLGESKSQKLRVFYGAYEAGEETSQEIVVSDTFSYKVRNVALVEMEIIYELLSWIKATERFTKFGIASDLAEVSANDDIISFAKIKLDELDKCIAYNSLDAISKASKNLNNAIRQNNSSILPTHPFYYLSDKVNNVLETFDKELISIQQLSAAKFYVDTHRYGQASIALKEYLISLLTEASAELSPKEVLKIYFRKPAEQLIGLLTPDNINAKDLEVVSHHEEVKNLICEWDADFYHEIYSSMSSLQKIRNTFAHAKKLEIGSINKCHNDLLKIIEIAPSWVRVIEAPVNDWFALIKPWYDNKNQNTP